MTHAQKVVEILRKNADLLLQVAEYIITDGLEGEETYELAESICEAAFGKRLECPSCGSMVFPGFLCWGCEDWTAPMKGDA